MLEPQAVLSRPNKSLKYEAFRVKQSTNGALQINSSRSRKEDVDIAIQVLIPLASKIHLAI
jgi:hypothetical protein